MAFNNSSIPSPVCALTDSDGQAGSEFGLGN
jgi:hypothetical protein